MKFELTITEETFKNDKGEDIAYYSCVAEIGGTIVRFFPRTEDKTLLKYLLTKLNPVGGK